MDFPFNNAFPVPGLTARLVIEADFDPQFPVRVLHRFSELGRLPERFVASASETAGLRVEVEFAGSADAARLLSRRLLNLPSTRSVELTFRRGAAAPALRAA